MGRRPEFNSCLVAGDEHLTAPKAKAQKLAFAMADRRIAKCQWRSLILALLMANCPTVLAAMIIASDSIQLVYSSPREPAAENHNGDTQ
jgi:hypothetical protein